MKNQINNPRSKIIYLIATCLILVAFGPPTAELSLADSGRGSPPGSLTKRSPYRISAALTSKVRLPEGKGVINLPSGGLIVTGPAQYATFTNLSDPTKAMP